MASMHRILGQSLARRGRMALVGLLLVTMGSGLVVARESSDTSEMSVSILPNGDTDSMAQPPFTEPPRDRLTANLPGTVTALLTVADGEVETPTGPWTPVVTTLMVTDDRGTADGWDVLLSAPGSQPESAPVLMVNRRNTIAQMVPFASLSTVQGSDVNSGGMLGPIERPTVILQAERGTGAGVYVQRLVILFPSASGDDQGIITVEFPFAP